MDIVVTVPKSELANVALEEIAADEGAGLLECYWKIRCVPRRLNEGDRVYFIHNGMIINYNVYTGDDETDAYCGVTGRTWPGLNLIMNTPSVPLKSPVPMKGFQGFRYIERIEP